MSSPERITGKKRLRRDIASDTDNPVHQLFWQIVVHEHVHNPQHLVVTYSCDFPVGDLGEQLAAMVKKTKRISLMSIVWTASEFSSLGRYVENNFKEITGDSGIAYKFLHFVKGKGEELNPWKRYCSEHGWHFMHVKTTQLLTYRESGDF